jgi:hypothetical protein
LTFDYNQAQARYGEAYEQLTLLDQSGGASSSSSQFDPSSVTDKGRQLYNPQFRMDRTTESSAYDTPISGVSMFEDF